MVIVVAVRVGSQVAEEDEEDEEEVRWEESKRTRELEKSSALLTTCCFCAESLTISFSAPLFTNLANNPFRVSFNADQSSTDDAQLGA